MDVKHRSREVTDGPERAPARAFFRAMGLGDQDMRQSWVGVASTWNEATPCNLALVRLAGCDKSLPGMLMAMARMNLPSVFLYGGTILPGRFRGRDVTILDVY